MKTNDYKTGLITLLLLAVSISSFSQMKSAENNVKPLISQYQEALNNSDSEKMIKLFADDGVLVLQNAPTSVGKEKISAFYNDLFNMLEFDLSFTVEEVVFISDTWAFIRTSTSGTVTFKTNNASNKTKGHEIFILQKVDEDWKIARYAGASSS